jgi:hypothetical protein
MNINSQFRSFGNLNLVYPLDNERFTQDGNPTASFSDKSLMTNSDLKKRSTTESPSQIKNLKAGEQVTFEGLRGLLANSYSLYLKTQNFHWNVKGLSFGPYIVFFSNNTLNLQ